MHSRIWLLAMVAAITAAGSAQSTPNAQAPVKIVKKTQLVYVPVVVNDKHGKHIGGLGKDMFKVEQDGHPQTISIFEEISHAVPLAKAAPTFPADSGYVENFSNADEKAHSLTIIVLDTLNTPFLKQLDARRQLIQYLGKSLQAEIPVSLMVLNSSGLKQVHPFTSDTATLIEAVKKVQSQMNAGESADADLQAAMGDENDPTADQQSSALLNDMGAAYFNRYVQMSAARATLRALEQLSGLYQGVAGRKNVVWATGGFPFLFADPQSLTGLGFDFVQDYKRAFDLLNNANMSIYAVDVSGLTAAYGNPMYAAGAPMPQAQRRGIGAVSPNAPRYNISQQKQDTLRAFADATGGKVFINSNDFAKAFEAATADGAAYYLVGYYLHDDDKPGWHKLKVKVNTSHAEVRAREGFLVPATEDDTPKAHVEQLAVATLAPANYTGVHFGVLIHKLDASPAGASAAGAKRTQTFHLTFPKGTLGLDASQDNLVSVDLLAVAFLKKEKEAGERISGIRAHPRAENFATFQKNGLGLEEHIELPPGEYELRIAIRDNVNHTVGSVRTHVVVP